MKKVRIVVVGKGRLGSAIVAEAQKDKEIEVASIIDRQNSILKAAKKGDVVIDASRGDAVEDNLRQALDKGTAYILAATGYPDDLKKKIEAYGKKYPIVVAPNLSIGVAVLHDLARLASESLADAKVEIVETHHTKKKDSPSGTALSLAQALPTGTPIRSIREGDVIGEHVITFHLDGETVRLSHSAGDRSIFAKGALRAAKFVDQARPGVYSMRDV
jgi:4-hydroxy-tetrahydrodipicolinate reductase